MQLTENFYAATKAAQRAICLLIAIPVSILLLFSAAHGQQRQEPAQLSFISGFKRHDGKLLAALRFDLEPGWKTYWRHPGEAGIAPEITLSGPNIKSAMPLWPSPQLFDQGGILGIGYAEQLVLPILITPEENSIASRVTGEIHIGVCRDICVPMSFRFEGRLSPERTRPDPSIIAALSSQPLSAREAGIGPVRCEAMPLENGQMRLSLGIEVGNRATPEHLSIEAGPSLVSIPLRPKIERTGSMIRTDVILERRNGHQPVIFARSRLRLTLIGNGPATELQGCTG